MKTKKPINIINLFTNVLGDKITDFTLPPPSFDIMQCEIIDFNEEEKSLITKIPVLEQWQNPYGTMQGGMIDAAIDNAVGPLSMLVASANMTRTIETKLIKAITMEVGFIYVKAKLVEQKKRRLTFEAEVVDEGGVVYASSRVVNFIL
jgi:acyl-coenzyme A thioesterase PaaI-like protein